MTRDDLFDSIIPTTMTKLSNKKVQRKIDCIKKCGGICKTYENDIEDLKDLGENSLKVIHEDTLCQKYKIEDKAKALTFISTIAATLAVALLTASSQTLVEEGYPRPIILAFCILCLLGLSYMVIAGANSIKIFTALIETRTYNYADRDPITEYKKCIAFNRLMNIMRTNFLFSSFCCLRNSLLLLLFTCLIKAITSIALIYHCV